MIALAVIAAVVVAILVFFPTVRRVIRILIVLVITLGASAIALSGIAILMNNVSISDDPGIPARVRRFLTVDWAATSAKGDSLAPCQQDAASAGAPANEGATKAMPPRGKDRGTESGRPTASPSETAAANPPEDIYPELVRRGYPGLSRAKLFALAKETVGELGGWKVVKEEPHAYTLECIYTSRVLEHEDQVRIVVTPRSEIDLCSHSGTGEPGSGAWEWLFSGDFGANIGHIKEFYLALEPKIDKAYREQEHKQGDAG
ncbi:MAG TPA: hypothetical protein VMB26_06675 [Candidatus Binataceae bacterium]|nr:hypothetical protein [Candidatus Binataceae bacterium]